MNDHSAQSLTCAIAQWDGKSVADIKAIATQYECEPGYADILIGRVHQPDLERGATWLLKHWLEGGRVLEQHQTHLLLSHLDALGHWEAKLHLLQSFAFLVISDIDHPAVYRFLCATLSDSNKFVRAWSYHGLHILGCQHAQYGDEARQRIEAALVDEAPSVKARIRQIIKHGGPASVDHQQAKKAK